MVHIKTSLKKRIFMEFDLYLPLPFSRIPTSVNGTESSNLNLLVFLVVSPILSPSRGPILCYLISINSGVIARGSLSNKTLLVGNAKGFRSSVPGTGDKDQIYLLLYHAPPLLCCASFILRGIPARVFCRTCLPFAIMSVCFLQRVGQSFP